MRRLTAHDDPSGVGVAVLAVLSALFVALGVSDVVAAEWMAVATAVVGLASLLWVRRHAWAPGSIPASVRKAKEGPGA